MPTLRQKKTARTSIVSDNSDTDHASVDEESSTVSRSVGAPTAPTLVAPDGILAPLLPSAPTTRSNQAFDISYFFTRGSKTEGTSTFCKTCQSVFFFFTYFIVLLIAEYDSEPRKLVTQLRLTFLHLSSLPTPATPLFESILQGITKRNTLKSVLQILGRTDSQEMPVFLKLRTLTRNITPMEHSCRKL